jgi:hypothetical protein
MKSAMRNWNPQCSISAKSLAKAAQWPDPNQRVFLPTTRQMGRRKISEVSDTFHDRSPYCACGASGVCCGDRRDAPNVCAGGIAVFRIAEGEIGAVIYPRLIIVSGFSENDSSVDSAARSGATASSSCSCEPGAVHGRASCGTAPCF